jgi:CDP-4-dehydro-6-deoxyglucose reductase
LGNIVFHELSIKKIFMFQITLKNGKSFTCDAKSTIFEAAKVNQIFLEHSCLSARCRSCIVKVESGTTVDKLDDLVLSSEEKFNNWILSCNAIPKSDILLDVEDLGELLFCEKQIVPAKIQSINILSESIIEVSLRLPPSSKFGYMSGQYVNIAKGQIKRSYSIANAYKKNTELTFFIKKYENGLMSDYWFNSAKVNDLLRIEGPNGTFFLRETKAKNLIFLATGTGVAPIKAILESVNLQDEKYQNKHFWVFNGARYESDLFWKANELDNIPNFKYIPVLSRPNDSWSGESGYVQEIILKEGIDLTSAQVYACGSNNMIESSKKLLIEKGLNIKQFFSDAFLTSN